MAATLDTQDWTRIMQQLAQGELTHTVPASLTTRPSDTARRQTSSEMGEFQPGSGVLSEPDLLADALLALWTGSSSALLNEFPPEIVRMASRLMDGLKRTHRMLRPPSGTAVRPGLLDAQDLPPLGNYPDPELDALRAEAMTLFRKGPIRDNPWDPQVPLDKVPRAGSDMPDVGSTSVPGSAQRDLGELFDLRQKRGDDMDMPSWDERLKEYRNYSVDRPNIDTPNGPQPDIPGVTPPTPPTPPRPPTPTPPAPRPPADMQINIPGPDVQPDVPLPWQGNNRIGEIIDRIQFWRRQVDERPDPLGNSQRMLDRWVKELDDYLRDSGGSFEGAGGTP